MSIGRTLIIHIKGGQGSGWHAPPKGTHTGAAHNASGSGKSRIKSLPGFDMMKNASRNSDKGSYYIPEQSNGQHELAGQYSDTKYVYAGGRGGTVPMWTHEDEQRNAHVVRVTYHDGYLSGGRSWHVDEGTAGSDRMVADARDFDYSWPNGATFGSKSDAQKYLQARYGISWDGSMRQEDAVGSAFDSPARSMARLQVSQAVSQGRISQARARTLL